MLRQLVLPAICLMVGFVSSIPDQVHADGYSRSRKVRSRPSRSSRATRPTHVWAPQPTVVVHLPRPRVIYAEPPDDRYGREYFVRRYDSPDCGVRYRSSMRRDSFFEPRYDGPPPGTVRVERWHYHSERTWRYGY